jgi:isopentenyl diphosphate isomerase/L-lactate dehydrogenase-like FMN-dependent dehydrogenase
MTREMVGWLKANTRMRVVLKGIVTAEDARLAVEHGADGVIVSNHGGRQLDGEPGTLACLEEVVDAIGGKLPVLIESGFRRGTDVFKALALGADAACVGRPYCWGLAAFGEAGARRALEILQDELVRAMRLAGRPSLDRIDRAALRPAGR